MTKWGYSVTDLNLEKTAKASGREMRVSPKHAREVCNTIKGMKLDQAKDYLRQVMLKKKAWRDGGDCRCPRVRSRTLQIPHTGFGT